ncbi:hypothetical protein HDV00_007621 [Rhizophlyctis rosea]|nr:hypothetical protein HDV00_007621 [Rhizophlyctis rosea]
MDPVTIAGILGSTATILARLYDLVNAHIQSRKEGIEANREAFLNLQRRATNLQPLLVNIATQSENQPNQRHLRQPLLKILQRLRAVYATIEDLTEKQPRKAKLRNFFQAADNVGSILSVASQEFDFCVKDLTLLFTVEVNGNAKSSFDDVKKGLESVEKQVQAQARQFAAAQESDAQSRKVLHADMERIKASMNETDRQREKQTKDIYGNLAQLMINVQQPLDDAKLGADRDLISETAGYQIYKASYSGDRVVIKAPRASGHGWTATQSVDVENELLALYKLKGSPYVPMVYGCLHTGVMRSIVMRHVEGSSLKDYLYTEVVEWSVRIRLAHQLASAITFMHKRGVIHGHLTSSKVLITKDESGSDIIQIIGFDSAVVEHATTVTPLTGISNRTDDHPWIAPEIFSTGIRTRASDIFALGTILWELMFCTRPYAHIDPYQVADYIKQGGRDELPKKHVPQSLAYLVKACWEQDLKHRPVAKAIEEYINTNVVYPNLALLVEIDYSTLRTTQHRSTYLLLRASISIEDLTSILLLAEFLHHIPNLLTPTHVQSCGNAEKWLEIGAKSGSGRCAAQLAEVYRKMRNSGLARQWLETAAELGHPRSIMELAKGTEGEKRVKKDMEGIRRMMDEMDERREKARMVWKESAVQPMEIAVLA